VLQALDYIHSMKKIHRDVKAANILINSLGQVKLTDFGICSKQSNSDSFIGTLLWMAPEMLSCSNYDSSVDIWALGICIIEMAEGNAPYHHLHMIRAKFAIQKKPQTQFTEPEKYSREIKDFLDKCLQIKPGNRPRASELLGHEFIEKYRGNMSEIRKKMCQERIQKLEEYRKNMIIQKFQSGHKVLDDIELNTEKPVQEIENNHIINVSNIDCMAAPVDNRTFIEKSSIIEPSYIYNEAPSSFPEETKAPESQLQFAINQLKCEENVMDDTVADCSLIVGNQNNQENQQEITEVSAFSLHGKPTNRTNSEGITSDLFNIRIPQVDIRPPKSSAQKPPVLSESTPESLMKKALTESSSSSAQKEEKVTRVKNYKATNESNFVVKHKGISKTAVNTELNQSMDNEATLKPITVRLKENGNMDFVKQVIFGDFNKKRVVTGISGTNLGSTAAQSKVGSTTSFVFKTPGHTPNPSEKQKIMGYNQMIREDLKNEKRGIRDEELRMEEERVRIEEEMRREMELIQAKYMEKLQSLKKEKA
jgi:serine/threonine protein kinase